MTKLLEKAIEKARALPVARQDEAVRLRLGMAANDASEAPRLTEE